MPDPVQISHKERIINLVLKHRSIYKNLRLFFVLFSTICKHIPHGIRKNFVLNTFSAWIGGGKSFGTPSLLCIEPTNVCDQKCTICETGLGILGRPKQFMTFDQFISILNQFDEKLTHIFFYFMGEPLLNKDSYRMIRYAADRGIWVSTCTNGNHVDPDQLVKSGIGEVNFQIGGMTQETHDIYRKGGKLHIAMKNLEDTIRIRNSSPEFSKMKINAGFILMKHNEHQVDAFIEYCTKAGVDNYSIIGTCIRNYAQGEKYLPSDTSYWSYDVDEYQKGKLVPKIKSNNYCEWIYSTMTVLVNGDVVPCCRDPCGTIILGNLFQENFGDIWNNEKYRKLRKRVSTDSNHVSICKLCSGYTAPIIQN